MEACGADEFAFELLWVIANLSLVLWEGVFKDALRGGEKHVGDGLGGKAGFGLLLENELLLLNLSHELRFFSSNSFTFGASCLKKKIINTISLKLTGALISISVSIMEIT